MGLEKEKAIQQYVLFRKEVLVALSGNLANPYRDYPLLLDREFWKTLPSLRWCGNKPESTQSVIIMGRNNGESENLSVYLAEYLGLEPGVILRTIGDPLDRRRINLTTSNLGACVGDGLIGIAHRKDAIAIQTGYNLDSKLHLGNCETDLIAQQLYNAILLENKMQEVDLRCFGRVENKGLILNMFPDGNFPFEKFIDKYPFLEDYYTGSGTLKPKYRPIMREHKHLVAPFTDKKNQGRLKRKGTDLSFTCLSRTPFNK